MICWMVQRLGTFTCLDPDYSVHSFSKISLWTRTLAVSAFSLDYFVLDFKILSNSTESGLIYEIWTSVDVKFSNLSNSFHAD